MEQAIGQVIQSLNYPTIDLDLEEEYILSKEEEESIIHNAIKLKASNLKFGVGEVDNRVERAVKYFDDAEIKKLLETANSNKHQNLWHKEQSEKRRIAEVKRMEELKKRCDANYFFNLFKYNADRKILLNANTTPYIKTICYYFSNDARFETELGLDFYKGLWIRGKAGLGKSFILSCIQDNDIIPFKVHSTIDIAHEVAESGEYEIIEPLKVIDDVGSEQTIVQHYGTKINWFKDFIELYYAQQKPFNYLIVTTNFDFDQIEKGYGFRVRSRIKDMFNIIDVKGEDLRGK